MNSGFFILIILVLFLVWLFLVRPQRRRHQAHEAMVDELRVGDEVLTAGGIYGTISRLDDDQVTVLIAPKTEVQVARRAIAGVTREPEADEDAEAEEPQEEDDEKWQSAFDEEGSTYSSETSDEEKRG